MRTLGRWCRSIERHLVVGAEGGLSSCCIDYVGWTVPWMVGIVKVSSRDKDGLIKDLSWTTGMSRRGIGMSRGRESLIRHRWDLKKSTLTVGERGGGLGPKPRGGFAARMFLGAAPPAPR